MVVSSTSSSSSHPLRSEAAEIDHHIHYDDNDNDHHRNLTEVDEEEETHQGANGSKSHPVGRAYHPPPGPNLFDHNHPNYFSAEIFVDND